MILPGRKTTFAERLEIGERWAAGESDPDIAKALSRSVWTVRKWRRRYQQHGRAGLISHMGRPAKGALAQFPLEMRDRIQEMRCANPGWGSKTILAELQSSTYFAGLRLPSRSRIAAFLHEAALTRPYERHSELPEPEKPTAGQAHTEWEMDAQGVMQVSGLGAVAVINIGDPLSRLKVASMACVQTIHPSTQDYYMILRRAFSTYGLPERISLDHAKVFYDSSSASPYPMILQLWLIALGVEVRFIKRPPPAEHSFIERMHQTVTQQAIAGQQFAESDALQQRLSERLTFLNEHLPCRTLHDQPPLVAFPEARQTPRRYRLEWEEALLDMELVYAYLARGRWFRHTSSQGQFSLGAQRYRVGKAWAGQTLEITFNPQTGELDCLSEDGQQVKHLPIKGLTKADLMGELSPLLSVPVYQLALPLSPAKWREMAMVGELTGTTL